MANWKQETRRGEVVGATLQIGKFKISVHRHIHYAPDQWLATAYSLFDCKELKSTSFEDAKTEAIEALENILTNAINELKSVQ